MQVSLGGIINTWKVDKNPPINAKGFAVSGHNRAERPSLLEGV